MKINFHQDDALRTPVFSGLDVGTVFVHGDGLYIKFDNERAIAIKDRTPINTVSTTVPPGKFVVFHGAAEVVLVTKMDVHLKAKV